MADVPCGSCRLCCTGHTLVMLVPGDDVASYETVPYAGGHRLAMKDNGDCVYLGETGCTIHERVPAMCSAYDCRAQHRMYNREQRRDMIARGLLNAAIMKRAVILMREAK